MKYKILSCLILTILSNVSNAEYIIQYKINSSEGGFLPDGSVKFVKPTESQEPEIVPEPVENPVECRYNVSAAPVYVWIDYSQSNDPSYDPHNGSNIRNDDVGLNFNNYSHQIKTPQMPYYDYNGYRYSRGIEMGRGGRFDNNDWYYRYELCIQKL